MFLRKFLLFMIAVSTVFALWGCSGTIGTVWSYSDTGKEEVELVYKAFFSENSKLIIGFTMTEYDDFGTETETYGLRLFIDESGETNYYKYVYIEGDTVTHTRLHRGNEVYYINEVEKTVRRRSETITNEYGITMPNLYPFLGSEATEILNYGIVTLNNQDTPSIMNHGDMYFRSQVAWYFFEKRNTTINNINDNEEAVIEYEYQQVDSWTSDRKLQSEKMLLNFRKTSKPILSRIQYETYYDGILYKTITVFPTFYTTVPKESDFEIPLNGYKIFS